MGKTVNGLRCSIFLLIGIIFSGIVTVMYLAKSINLERFYNVGNIYDVAESEYRKKGNQWEYDHSEKVIVLKDEFASHSFDLETRQKKWNYLYLEIEKLDGSINWDVEFLDQDDEVLYTVSQKIQNGQNILTLQDKKIYGINIVIRNQKDAVFAIKKIQFREQMPTFRWNEAIKIYGIMFLCYLLSGHLICSGFGYLRRRNIKNLSQGSIIQEVQKFYIYLLNKGKELCPVYSEKRISQIRRVFFFVSILIIYFMVIMRWRWQILPQRRLVALLAVCLLLIAFLSWKRAKPAVNWKNPLVSAWFVLWIMCIISEFVVEKRIRNEGIFMLGVMGPLYMAWNSMERPEQFLKDFLKALQWSYWTGCVFCIFFRPLIPGIRYMGLYNNPNPFAGYLVTVNIVFLVWLDESLNKEKLRFGTVLKNALGLVSICYFLCLTESVTSFVVYLLEWIIFLWKQFPNNKRKAYGKNAWKILTVSLVCGIVAVIPGKWCLVNIPHMLDTAITLPGDAYEPREEDMPFSFVSHAATEETGMLERISDKSLSGSIGSLLSGRDKVWMVYIRQLNLFGHSGYLEYQGITMHAHNSLLQMMYKYGVFICVPFLIMLYYGMKYSIQIIFSKQRNLSVNLFFVEAVVNYLVQGIAEDVSTPYSYVSWFVFFIAIGGMFNQSESKNVSR